MRTDTKLTHPADGLFYLTVEALDREGACWSGLRAFMNAAREVKGGPVTREEPVLVTVDLVRRTFAHSRCGLFLIDVLGRKTLGVQYASLRAARTRYQDAPDDADAAWAVMDAVAAYGKSLQPA